MPCDLKDLPKTTAACIKCRVRVGLPDNKTPAEVAALRDEAIKEIKELRECGHRRNYYSPQKYSLTKQAPSKCAMPWCTVQTRGEYCVLCKNMLRARIRRGVTGEALYAKPERRK